MSDDRLSTALRELGDVPPPADLAGSALVRAGRDRRRTVTGLIAGVAVLAAAAVTVPALALGRPAQHAAGGASRVVVAGFVSYNPDLTSDEGEKRVYDPSSGQYVTPSWDTAVPSPDGKQVAVTATYASDGLTEVGIVAVDRVLDPAAVRWVPDGHDARKVEASRPAIVWSADGSRLLVNDVYSETVSRVDWTGLVVDARTLAWREVAFVFPPSADQNFPIARVVFGPGGQGFAAGPSRDSTDSLVRFDERGRRTGAIRTGTAAVPDRPFSPDGRLVAVQAGGSTRVLAVATGAEVGRADGDVIGWVDAGHYAVRDGKAVRVVELSSGRVVAEAVAPVADPRVLASVWLAPLVGAAPPGAVVL